MTSSTSAPARASAAASERSYGGVKAEGSTSETRMGDDSGVKLSYCVVNTNGREYLRACIAAIGAQQPPAGGAEILVLDNASSDGSAELLAELAVEPGPGIRVITLPTPEGKAANDSRLLEEAGGEYCLLLNEDSELQAGAAAALVAALDADPQAAAAGRPAARARTASRNPAPGACPESAPRSPGRSSCTGCSSPRAAARGPAASAGRSRRRCSSAAGPPSRSAGSTPTSSSTRTRPISASASPTPAGHTLYVPAARAIHHEQLSTDRDSGRRRIVEFHRNRDLYMRKHHGPLAALAVRVLTAISYLPRALAATVLPGHDPRWYLAHAGQALHPHGEGIREAAEAGAR